jgi:hypothetical protein
LKNSRKYEEENDDMVRTCDRENRDFSQGIVVCKSLFSDFIFHIKDKMNNQICEMILFSKKN